LPSAVAFTVTVSVAKLSVIEVAAEPVVIEIVLSVASPVVTVNVPVSEPAAMLPISPLTTSVADPASVSTLLFANAPAFTVMASPAPFAVIVVVLVPVVIATPSSVASPVVTVNAAVSDPAVMSPISPVTTSAADPASVSTLLLANAAAFTVSVSLAEEPVIEVVFVPIVIAMPLSTVLFPVVTFQRTAETGCVQITL
jgi:hypothetical protein